MVGSILRQVRRNRRPIQAWTDSTSSISSSDAESAKKIEFPNRIQQEPVDLELGLIPSTFDVNDENILEAARTWRRRSQLNREQQISNDATYDYEHKDDE